jgi:hypothetical protein
MLCNSTDKNIKKIFEPIQEATKLKRTKFLGDKFRKEMTELYSELNSSDC